MAGQSGIRELAPHELRWQCDPDRFGFENTGDFKPSQEIIGQPRATEAIRVGLEMDGWGTHIFAAGPAGTGRRTTIRRVLEEIDTSDRIPEDLCYVNNFRNPDGPRIMTLPPGEGRNLKRDMDKLIMGLSRKIPCFFESEAYQKAQETIVGRWSRRQMDSWRRFDRETRASGFALVEFPAGSHRMARLFPVVEGKPIDLGELESMRDSGVLSDDEFQRTKAIHEDLVKRLEELFRDEQTREEKTEEAVDRLNRETLQPLIRAMISDMRKKYGRPKALTYFDEVETAIIENLDRFQSRQAKTGNEANRFETIASDPFLDFRVNVLVDHSDSRGAPIVIEESPTYQNLFGTLDRGVSPSGLWTTDFTRIRAGSLIRANGGYLILNAHDALIEPGIWTTLKRALRNGSIEIQAHDTLYPRGGVALKPEPVELALKIIMIGDNRLYNRLCGFDKDFRKIFKIKADFDSVMERMDGTVTQYASFISHVCEEERLMPFHKTGVAAMVEHGVRLGGRQNKISTRFDLIEDVIREAHYWATKAGSDVVHGDHVEEAIRKRIYRVNMVEEKIREMISDGTIMIDAEGAVVGQVNGLAMYQSGDHRFAKPSRITAKTSMGRAGIINIEREADLSGRAHNKGVLILAGYLRGKYAQDKPLTMSASVCFEQSYTGVDGDSASSTEVYAILSCLSGLPLRQDVAVTGSVNQKGEVQPIGGVNEKIEGFFDLCRIRGLTGKQGVMVPRQNTTDLMLRSDVVSAVGQGKFHIYPVTTIDEGVEILAGVEAGDPDSKGRYPSGTVNDRVDRRLRDLAEKMRDFGRPRKPTGKKGEPKRKGRAGGLINQRSRTGSRDVLR